MQWLGPSDHRILRGRGRRGAREEVRLAAQESKEAVEQRLNPARLLRGRDVLERAVGGGASGRDSERLAAGERCGVAGGDGGCWRCWGGCCSAGHHCQIVNLILFCSRIFTARQRHRDGDYCAHEERTLS